MNKRLYNPTIKKNISILSKALFVLSQFANKRKIEISSLNQLISSKSLSDMERNEYQQKLNKLNKLQQYFHAERTEIFRFLIHSKMVVLKGFIHIGGYNYGLIQMDERQFYLILNKKMIEQFKLKKIGEELNQIVNLPLEQLNEILPLRDAEKVFKQTLVRVRSTLKKAKKTKERIPALTCPKEQVLSKSLSSNGSIVVIKKRKFSTLASANK